MTTPHGGNQAERESAQLDLPEPAVKAPGQNALLLLQKVSKSFNARSVLSSVDLEVKAGRIHGLVGNNGAGKLTLVKIITGTYSASPGSSIAIGGHAVGAGSNEQLARQLGIRVVHQEAPLIDTFTVAEMVAILQGYPTRFGRIRWRQLKRETRRLLDRFDIPVDPDARSAFLRAAERALVTLAIALNDIGQAGTAPMLILDEATASVPAEDAKGYLDAVRGVADGGGGVLMVSHRLQEIIDYCDAVTVLSDGRVVYDGTTSGLTVRELSEYMVGDVSNERTSGRSFGTRTLPASWGFEQPEGSAFGAVHPPVLRADDLRGPNVRGVSLTVESGEIVGLSGLFGSGVSEISRLIAGVETATGGVIHVDGHEPLALRGRVHRALNSGIAYLSSDRAHEGGIATLSMQENAFLPTVSRYCGQKSCRTDAHHRGNLAPGCPAP